MKRFLLLVLGLIALCVLVQSADTQIRQERGGQDTDAVWIVVPADYSGPSLRGGDSRIAVCDGTAATGTDQVELQAANDAAAAAGGGIVRVPGGTLYLSKPAGAVDVAISSCTLTKQSPSSWLCRLSVIKFGDGDMDDVAIGQSFRFSEGADDAGGESLEDNDEELVATVTAVDSPADTITVWGRLENTYTGTVAVRLIPAFNLTKHVSIIGDGLQTTYLKLANEQDCDVVHVFDEYTAASPYARLQDLTIDGNKTQQGDKAGDSWNGECNGLVIGEWAKDVYLTRMSVENCKGDGIWCNAPWGVRIDGGWSETNIGTGLVITSRGTACVRGFKSAGNSTALWLRNSTSTMVTSSAFTADNINGETDNNAIRITNNAAGNMITGNAIASTDAQAGAAAHAILMRYSMRNVFTANNFDVDGTKTIFKGVAGEPNYANSNIITGNRFHGGAPFVVATTVLHDLWGSWQQGNLFKNNTPIQPVYECDIVYCKNTTGGALVRGNVVVLKAVAGGNEIAVTTTVGDADVFGVVQVNVADGSWIGVQRLGKFTSLRVSGLDAGGGNIAIGNLLCTDDDAGGGISRKAAAGDVAFAIALEVYVGEDSEGILDCLLISPRQAE